MTQRLSGSPSYRILFTSLPFLSHFLAQLPLASALRSAGNEVRFATSEELAGMVSEAGFDVVRVDFRQAPAPGMELSLRTASDKKPVFAWMPTAARVAPALIQAFERWLPHAVVRDPLEFGSCLAAEFAGIPHAVGREGPFWDRATRQELVGEVLDGFRDQLGLPPDPDTEMPYRYLAFAFAPPPLLPPGIYVPPVTHFIRPSPVDRVARLGDVDWAPPQPDATFVYATLGTVFNRRSQELLEAITTALAGQPYQALVTTGPGFDQAAFAWCAEMRNLTVLNYVPQSTVLPYCDAMVAHGGFHTVIGALLHGVPLVLVPVGGDQPRNARWCSASGAALVLADTQRDADSIRAGVRRVLSEEGYRDAAERLQRAMTELPPMSKAAALVEQLAATRTPIPHHGAGAPTA